MITKHHNYNGLITKQRAMITEQGSINYTGSLSRVTQTHDDLASPVCTYRPPAPNTLHASLTDARTSPAPAVAAGCAANTCAM